MALLHRFNGCVAALTLRYRRIFTAVVDVVVLHINIMYQYPVIFLKYICAFGKEGVPRDSQPAPSCLQQRCSSSCMANMHFNCAAQSLSICAHI